MRSLSTWLLVMFMFMFWVFRVIIAFTSQYGNDFGGFIAFDFNTEIILLFIAILAFVLVAKRKVLGGVIYLISYAYYFGSYIFVTALPPLLEGTASLSVLQNVMVSMVALIIAFAVFVDLLVDRAQKRTPTDRKTDWFFKNEKFDRQYDERADKNQYRNY